MVRQAEARRMREAIEALWTDVCSIAVRRAVQAEGGAEELREETIATGVKCRLSYIEAGAAQLDVAAQLGQRAKLMLGCELEVPPGSLITVERCGRQVKYRSSGAPRLYRSHQEIEMELSDRWA